MKKHKIRRPLVLVVDDDITIRMLARESLKQAGFGVEEAENGTLGLSAIKRLQPDIVLLDVIMPEMDGFRVCSSLRKLPGGNLLPVLMMTGMDDSASINRAYDVGATDFITKPINWVLLRHRVQYMLRASQTINELRKSEEKNRALLDAIPDVMIHFKKDGTILDFKTAKDIDLVAPPSDCRNKRIQDVFPLDVAQQSIEHLEMALKTGDSQNFEHEILQNGDQYYYEARIVVCGQEEALAIVRNITDKKRAEQEKKKLEAQLQQAQKMEALGTLTGGIAHDFNNLLMGIQGHVALISLDGHAAHSFFDHVEKIEQIVQKGAELTKQLLGFARGGKYKVSVTDLNSLIEESSQMFGRTKKEITIGKYYQKDLWPAEVDRGQIEQVLLNLYVNAWQAMPEGGVVYLQTENVIIDEAYVRPFTIEPGKYVKITVTDTGEGMDEHIKQRIFEPFFTTKEIGKGTGLGLASAYGIIKNHGGVINVYSEKGKGTAFTIYLPASEKEVKETKSLIGKTLEGRETILFVDDEDMIIEVGQRMLTCLGYKVLLARNGKEAIEVYRRNREKIDMVILDMIMPGIGGKETYARLKKMNPDIKVLFASGYSLNSQRKDVLKNTANGFIQKPFTMPQISQRIRKILDERQS